MKATASSLLIFVMLSAFECQRQEDVKPESAGRSIIGKWQLVEYYLSPGGPGYWIEADPNNPSIIEFKANGEYISDDESCRGQYTLGTDQDIIINMTCDSGETRQIELSGRILPAGELVLSPTNPICIEGCASKYKAIQQAGSIF